MGGSSGCVLQQSCETERTALLTTGFSILKFVRMPTMSILTLELALFDP